MAEFSRSDRLIKAVLGPVLLCVWGYFAPDYQSLFKTPVAQLTLADLGLHVSFALILIFLLYATVSWLYEAWTGRDAVWLWHPD